MEEGAFRRVEQKIRAGDSSDQAADCQWNHDPARNIEMLAIGTRTGRGSYPQRNRVGGIRWNGSNSGEQERGKSDKAASAGDSVKRAAESASEEQEDYGLQTQI